MSLTKTRKILSHFERLNLSRFQIMSVQSHSVLPYKCHQILHPWHKECIPAAWMLTKPCFRESFKIYCVLYGVRIVHWRIFLIKKILLIYSGYRSYKIKKNSNTKRITSSFIWIS